MKRTGWSRGLKVTGNGRGVVAHAGAAALRLLADRTGLTAALSAAMTQEGFAPVHDRGRVLCDAAVMTAAGGSGVRGIKVLRHQQPLLGPVASAPTLCRVLREIDPTRLELIDTARARVREQVWARIVGRHGRIPPARVPGGDLGEQIVLRIDANFIDAYSPKAGAARLRGRFGHHPMRVFCDNTGECLAEQLRPGSAGAKDADDHIALIRRAIAQLPATHRRNLLITADGAGATHRFLDWLVWLTQPGGELAPGGALHPGDGDGEPGEVRVEFSVGWTIDRHTGPVIAGLPTTAWAPMLRKDGTPGIPAQLDEPSDPDTVGEVAEITDRLAHLRHWPPGTRVFIRRLKPLRGTTPAPLPGVHPDQPALDGLDITPAVPGWRYEAFATATAGAEAPWLDGRHRVHARVEDRIRVGNQTGAARLPSQDFEVNTAWFRLVALGTDLLAWLQLLGCEDELAQVEPKTLQYCVLHAPASLTRSGRRRWLNFPPDWPWTRHIVAIFTRLQALPAPT